VRAAPLKFRPEDTASNPFQFGATPTLLDLIWLLTAAGFRDRISEVPLYGTYGSRSPNVAGYKHHILSPTSNPVPSPGHLLPLMIGRKISKLADEKGQMRTSHKATWSRP
jgi:hypothetical protein